MLLTLLIILSTISGLGMLAIFIMVLLDYKGNNSSLVRHPALKGEAWFSPSCYLIYPKDRGGFHRDVEVFR